MGKKIWLSMDPRNFGSEKIVCTTNVRPYVRPPGHVSRGEVLQFKYARVSAVNRIATRTFTDEKQQQQQQRQQQQQSRFFLSLNFNVCIDVDNRERAKATNKK